MTEEQLPGGFVNAVVRVGDTVRRRPGERAAFVHDLLRHLEAHQWPGAPRFLGIDETGREVLTHLDGYVPWDTPRPPVVSSAASLRSVGRLLREFHDLTAGTPLAGNQEVVCHNDLSPKNTVYAEDGARAIAFLDWDLAAPGRRIHDLAFCCWQYADLGRDVAVTVDQWLALCDGYGPADLTALVATLLWWQDRAWRGIESGAESETAAAAAAAADLKAGPVAGSEVGSEVGSGAGQRDVGPMTRLVALGVPDGIRAAYDWVAANAGVLDAAVRRAASR